MALEQQNTFKDGESIIKGPYLIDGQFVPTVFGGIKVQLNREKMVSQVLAEAEQQEGQKLVEKIAPALGNMRFYVGRSVTDVIRLTVAEADKKSLLVGTYLFLVPLLNRHSRGGYFHSPEKPIITIDIPRISKDFLPLDSNRNHLKVIQSFGMMMNYLASAWVHERQHMFNCFMNPKLSSDENEKIAVAEAKKASRSDLNFLQISPIAGITTNV